MTRGTSQRQQKAIAKYYRQCNNAYRDAWGMDQNLQLNLGLWKKDTKNLKQALQNLNNEVADLGMIKKSDRVLDAGCGVGGTAISLAKNIGCKVVGITIAPNQLKQAKINAQKTSTTALCDFKLMDFAATTFPDESFDVIVGIESICYAESKKDFLREAYRLLKKGGRIVLAENLQAKAQLSKEEYTCLYTNTFNGCKVNALDTEEQYLKNLRALNFSEPRCIDYTAEIRPSIRRLRRFYYPALIYNKWHRLIGKPFTQTQEANTKMCYYLLRSLNQNLWKYGIINAIK